LTGKPKLIEASAPGLSISSAERLRWLPRRKAARPAIGRELLHGALSQ
jgi:hypothetical protein